MDEGWWADEKRVRAGILELVTAAASDADLDVLGAAVMEVFVADDDDRLGWLEEQARASERFRRSLANVWVWGCEADSVAQRVELAAGVPLVRPPTTLNAEQVAALAVAKRLRASVAALEAALDLMGPL